MPEAGNHLVMHHFKGSPEGFDGTILNAKMSQTKRIRQNPVAIDSFCIQKCIPQPDRTSSLRGLSPK
jgi:hypothetical protein